LAKPSVDRAIPLSLFGIDLTETLQVMNENFEALMDPNAAKQEEARKRFHRQFEEAARRSVKPDV